MAFNHSRPFRLVIVIGLAIRYINPNISFRLCFLG